MPADDGFVYATPSPGVKRKKGANQIEGSVCMTAETQQDRDTTYIMDCLQKGDRLLSHYLAGLLRDGVIQRAMRRVQTAPFATALGRRLPHKLRKLAGLPPRVKVKFVCSEVDALAALVKEDGVDEEKKVGDEGDDQGEDEMDGTKLTFPADLLDALMAFALNCDLTVKAPSMHFKLVRMRWETDFRS